MNKPAFAPHVKRKVSLCCTCTLAQVEQRGTLTVQYFQVVSILLPSRCCCTLPCMLTSISSAFSVGLSSQKKQVPDCLFSVDNLQIFFKTRARADALCDDRDCTCSSNPSLHTSSNPASSARVSNLAGKHLQSNLIARAHPLTHPQQSTNNRLQSTLVGCVQAARVIEIGLLRIDGDLSCCRLAHDALIRSRRGSTTRV